jgi:hypothetical protein
MSNNVRQHGHPRAWMTILLTASAALIILVMCFAALQFATLAGR